MNDTDWTPTRRGGYRRSRTGVAQQLGNLREASTNASAAAATGKRMGVKRSDYLEERSRHTREVVGSNPAPGTLGGARGPFPANSRLATGRSRLAQIESVRQLRSLRENLIFKWHEQLGLPSCPYLIRWRFETPWGSIRLHHWLGPDDSRHRHDHPWGFVTFVLRGGYTDLSPSGDEHLRAPAIRYRPATHQHTVVPDNNDCWTVIVTGPRVRPWGFWVNGKFKKANKYFLTFGHHPCN